MWEEVFEGLGRREGLLDLFGSGKVSKDGGAFDGGTAFQVVAAGPGSGGLVLVGAVQGAEVDKGYFVVGGR